jgi:hypothetical protein
MTADEIAALYAWVGRKRRALKATERTRFDAELADATTRDALEAMRRRWSRAVDEEDVALARNALEVIRAWIATNKKDARPRAKRDRGVLDVVHKIQRRRGGDLITGDDLDSARDNIGFTRPAIYARELLRGWAGGRGVNGATRRNGR